MHIAIDIRSLLSPHHTGVGEFTIGMLRALEVYTDHTYSLYYNAAKPVTLPAGLSDIGDIVHTAYPNKFVTTMAGITKFPKVDTIVEKQTGKKVDLLYTPNIQFAPHTSSTPHIMTIHDLSFLHMPEYYTRRQRLWHRVHRLRYQAARAAAIVVPSESTRTDVVATLGVAAEKVRVVYPGIAPAAFAEQGNESLARVRQTYNLPNKYIFFLGTLEPRKNVPALIEAFERSELVSDGYSLVIAGAPGWNNDALMQRIANTPEVRYIGYVAAADKPALFALAATFVYPSIFEGFGFPVLEAMAQGTPVITSNRSSLPEITNGHARLVHPNNLLELTTALKESVVRDVDTSLRIGCAREYTWQRAAEQLDNVFETYGR